MTDRVRVNDVSPRDGLQNEPGVVSTADKANLVRALATSGVDEVEVSSFVSPRWVPQLGDAAELFELVAGDKPEGVIFSALVPNERGAERALATNEHAGIRLIDTLSIFTAASETFSQRNTNASIEETLARFEPVARLAHDQGLQLRAYISCVIACPFEGPILPDAVARVGARLLDLGVDELDLGDTIGAGDEASIAALLSEVLGTLGERAPAVSLHLHDTFGRAGDCVRTALDFGVRRFDAAVGGLGGCPYASTATTRAPGNLSTRALLDVVEAAGFAHGVNRDALAAAEGIATRVVAEATTP
ncbi:MAG: hydroxymethylglutaryl-CoA lyase [Planctomycetota bacterium]